MSYTIDKTVQKVNFHISYENMRKIFKRRAMQKILKKRIKQFENIKWPTLHYVILF